MGFPEESLSHHTECWGTVRGQRWRRGKCWSGGRESRESGRRWDSPGTEALGEVVMVAADLVGVSPAAVACRTRGLGCAGESYPSPR